MINNFIWNNVWTFRPQNSATKQRQHVLVRFTKFNLVCAGGLVIAVLVLKLGVKSGFHLYLSNLSAIAVATVWNFSGNVLFTWSDEKLKISEERCI